MAHSSSGHIYNLSLIINYFADCKCYHDGSIDLSCNGTGHCSCQNTFKGKICDGCTPGLKKSNGRCCTPTEFFDMQLKICKSKYSVLTLG